MSCKNVCASLNPQDLIWNTILFRNRLSTEVMELKCNPQGKPSSNGWCSYKKGKLGHRETTCRGKDNVEMPCEDRGKGSSPAVLEEACPASTFGTSSLQNYEMINYCCSKPPSLSHFVAATGNYYSDDTEAHRHNDRRVRDVVMISSSARRKHV